MHSIDQCERCLNTHFSCAWCTDKVSKERESSPSLLLFPSHSLSRSVCRPMRWSIAASRARRCSASTAARRTSMRINRSWSCCSSGRSRITRRGTSRRCKCSPNAYSSSWSKVILSCAYLSLSFSPLSPYSSHSPYSPHSACSNMC